MRRAVVQFALLWAIAACAPPDAHVGIDGVLEIFGPDAPFAGNRLPADWAADGLSPSRLARDVLGFETAGDTPVLTLAPAEKPYLLARRIDAFLLASSFLRWSWNMTDAGGREHPVRLAVGFSGGAPESGSRSRPLVRLGTPLPAYDRVLALTWGGSALERGLIESSRPAPRYVVRGGADNAGRWWTETVDLAALYRHAWPQDETHRTRIVFVGFAVPAAEADAPAGARFADIALSR